MKAIKKLLLRFARHSAAFVIVNTLLWLGFARVVIAAPGLLTLGGAIVAFIMGADLIYTGLTPAVTREMALSTLIRWYSVVLGAFSIALGAWGLVLFFGGDPSGYFQVRPRNLSLDGASLAVIVLGFLLPTAVSGWLHRRWGRKERALWDAAREEGEVFVIPSFFRGILVWVLVMTVAISSLFFVASLGPRSGVNPAQGAGLGLILSPVVFVCLYLLLPNSGVVVLTAEAVVLRRLWRETRLPYADIARIGPNVFDVLPRMVIRGADRVLLIPRTMLGLPRCYALLMGRVPIAVRDAALGTAEVQRFGIQIWVRWLAVSATVVYAGLYLAAALLGFWPLVTAGELFPLTWDKLQGPLFFFIMMSVIFLPLLVFAIRSFVRGEWLMSPGTLVALELHLDKLRYRLLKEAWCTRSAGDIRDVTLKVRPWIARARVNGVPIRQPMAFHDVVVAFGDGTDLRISQASAMCLGQTPERLYLRLRRMIDLA